ncbi:sn-glycerol-3-phosphate ABC transporter ATP-binding protein UgpC [Pseudovibrio sp. SPO723]|uniref:ABC transporter ATP-binding protein n=1 Tax=Nesiotobacter zosterae TaxID=392721 RepID=UPI0029C1E100|nr:sn-glycerol-3-phosphate ABC transporter ATP-binding protein UgpC [Pseudovibrio sp. SPO723]MDX5595171.1 sn-glycerol-3-phosphate ABC transporter ATP-binding protein UgpC [Pseudovibrio sp. SPO723]
MAGVELLNLSKSFGSVEVLKSLNLTIQDGEFVALVGPSGCGKSTLLRIIAGLEEETAGEVYIGGEYVNDLSPKERNIAMVFQSYALYPHMSVEENMGFNLRISGISKSDIKARVQETAEILDLVHLLDRKPSQLSGGQRQRVAMGRALVRNPDVFLFDEPLSNLDAKLRVQMREEIKRLHQRVRTTKIYVTHDQIEAMTLADRVVILNQGIIQQVGTPRELYQNPANAFVAGFIGSPAMNFLPATLTSDGTSSRIELEDGSILVADKRANQPSDGKILLGMRPEHLHLSAEKDEHSLKGRVDLIEPTGAQNHLRVTLAGKSTTVVDNSLTEVELGEFVNLKIDPDNLHLFSQ